MNSTAALRSHSSIWKQLLSYQSIPGWTLIVFCLAVAVSFAPNVLTIYGIHNDYEMLKFKRLGLFHEESETLFAVARPVAALLTNLMFLPVDTLQDYRWTRIFSIVTVWLLGAQLMSICLYRLRTRTPDAVILALGIFLVPPFAYSVLAAAAWPPHLLTILLSFVAYAVLSKSNVLLTSFSDCSGCRDYMILLLQAWAYARQKPVWLSCIVWQFALYDYPPNAMILALFPVITVLFSQWSRSYRALLAVRDVIFMGANIVIYAATAKLIYMPFVRLFTSRYNEVVTVEQTNPLEARIAGTYSFSFNSDLSVIWHRPVHLLKVAGDVWFLPQIGAHIAVAVTIVLAVMLANAGQLVARRRNGFPVLAGKEDLTLHRLAFRSFQLSTIITFATPVVCFLIAGAAVLASAKGFVTYRTIAMPIAITAVMFLFTSRGIVEAVWWRIGSPVVASSRMADIAMGGLVSAAIVANFYTNELTLRLARNEFAYFTEVVRQAIEKKSNTIMIIDPRPLMLPEDIPVVYDQRGRAVPPYELGCMSGYCLQTGSIVHVAGQALGYPMDWFKVYTARGEYPVPGLTCEMLTNLQSPLPTKFDQGARDFVSWIRAARPLTCLEYNLIWHDIGIDLEQAR